MIFYRFQAPQGIIFRPLRLPTRPPSGPPGPSGSPQGPRVGPTVGPNVFPNVYMGPNVGPHHHLWRAQMWAKSFATFSPHFRRHFRPHFRHILAPRTTPEMAVGGLLGPISSKRGGFRNFRLSRLKALVLLFQMSIGSGGPFGRKPPKILH